MIDQNKNVNIFQKTLDECQLLWYTNKVLFRGDGGIGRRAGLRILWPTLVVRVQVPFSALITEPSARFFCVLGFISEFFHRFRIVLPKEYRFGIISYNMIMLLYNVSKSYTKIAYGQFQLILKIAHSLSLRTFVLASW